MIGINWPVFLARASQVGPTWHGKWCVVMKGGRAIASEIFQNTSGMHGVGP
jgi:hypothetical protein